MCALGHTVEEFSFVDSFLHELHLHLYDALIIDVVDGGGHHEDTAMVKNIRTHIGFVPILLATGSGDSPAYRESMLNSGVDSCVQVPFSQDELRLRIAKLVCKKDTLLFEGTCISADDVSMDIRDHIVERRGQQVHLTPTEYSILFHLFLHKNALVSTGELTACLRGGAADDSQAVSIHIHNIRRKVRNERLIRTIPNYGFMVTERGVLV